MYMIDSVDIGRFSARRLCKQTKNLVVPHVRIHSTPQGMYIDPIDKEIFCSPACREKDTIHGNLKFLRGFTHLWSAFEDYCVVEHEHALMALKCLLVGETERESLRDLYSPRWSELEQLREPLFGNGRAYCSPSKTKGTKANTPKAPQKATEGNSKTEASHAKEYVEKDWIAIRKEIVSHSYSLLTNMWAELRERTEAAREKEQAGRTPAGGAEAPETGAGNTTKTTGRGVPLEEAVPQSQTESKYQHLLAALHVPDPFLPDELKEPFFQCGNDFSGSRAKIREDRETTVVLKEGGKTRVEVWHHDAVGGDVPAYVGGGALSDAIDGDVAGAGERRSAAAGEEGGSLEEEGSGEEEEADSDVGKASSTSSCENQPADCENRVKIQPSVDNVDVAFRALHRRGASSCLRTEAGSIGGSSGSNSEVDSPPLESIASFRDPTLVSRAVVQSASSSVASSASSSRTGNKLRKGAAPNVDLETDIAARVARKRRDEEADEAAVQAVVAPDGDKRTSSSLLTATVPSARDGGPLPLPNNSPIELPSELGLPVHPSSTENTAGTATATAPSTSRNFPPLPTLPEWDRLLGLCDLVSKDMSHSNPINRAIVHARIDPDSREFILRDCKLLWGKIALSWRLTQRAFEKAERDTQPDYLSVHITNSGDEVSPNEEAMSWKYSGKIFPGYEGLGVCRVVAFTNHSCQPNMEVSRIGETGRIQGKAIRKIKKGRAVLGGRKSFDSVPTFRKNFGGSTWWGYVVVYVGSGERTLYGGFVGWLLCVGRWCLKYHLSVQNRSHRSAQNRSPGLVSHYTKFRPYRLQQLGSGEMSPLGVFVE